MTTFAQTASTDSPASLTTGNELPSIDRDLLDGVVGGCAACGTPGQPCATGKVADPAAAALLAGFARR